MIKKEIKDTSILHVGKESGEIYFEKKIAKSKKRKFSKYFLLFPYEFANLLDNEASVMLMIMNLMQQDNKLYIDNNTLGYIDNKYDKKRSSIYRTLNKMADLNLITRTYKERGEYMVNPKIATKCNLKFVDPLLEEYLELRKNYLEMCVKKKSKKLKSIEQELKPLPKNVVKLDVVNK